MMKNIKSWFKSLRYYHPSASRFQSISQGLFRGRLPMMRSSDVRQ
uniref:Uncharacterized protein n=1 Tax=Arundo donax TaxID=35708 RepID=A0A0A8Z0W4_ARUDO